MDFSEVELTDDDRAFETEARRFFTERWSTDPLDIANDHDRVPDAVRLAMAERGWVRPTASRDEGGADLTAVQSAILERVMDELRVPGTGGSELFISTLTRFASDTVKREVLPGLLSGQATICLGYSEPDSGSDMAAARTRAVRDGDEWVINGQKIYTTWGHESDYVFLLTRTGTIEEKHRGLTVFLVPMSTPGIEARPLWILGEGRTNMTFYTDVRISDDYRIGEVGAGWQVVSEPLATEHGVGDSDGLSEISGTMGIMFTNTLDRLIDFAVRWADERGKLDDPHVRRTIAEATLDLEVCRNTPGELGKPGCAAALIRNADRFIDLAAPESILSREAEGSDAAAVLAWARMYAPGTDVYGGTTEIYRNNIARGLGLPRPY